MDVQFNLSTQGQGVFPRYFL